MIEVQRSDQSTPIPVTMIGGRGSMAMHSVVGTSEFDKYEISYQHKIPQGLRVVVKIKETDEVVRTVDVDEGMLMSILAQTAIEDYEKDPSE